MKTKTRTFGSYSGPQTPETRVTSRYIMPGNTTVLPSALWVPGYIATAESGWSTTSAGSETIQYDVRRLHNFCNHTKTKLTVYGGPYEGVYRHFPTRAVNTEWYRLGSQLSSAAAMCGLYQYGIRGIGELGALPAYAVPWNATTWQADYSARALKAMWPGVNKVNFSTLNFLWELKDVKSLIRTAKDVARKVGLIRHRFSRKLSRERNIGEALKAHTNFVRSLESSRIAASLHLASEFAIKPFVSDVHKIWTLAQGIKAEAERLRAGVGRRLVSHYREYIPNANAVEKYYDKTSGYGSYRITRSTTVPESVYHATMEYSYKLDEMTLRHLERYVALDRLGLFFDPSIVWNAIPWSFVVDWMLRVGDFLESYRRVHVRPVVKIHGFVHSVKYQRRVELALQQSYTNLSFINPRMTVGVEDQQTYIRCPYIPQFHHVLCVSGLSKREILLAASLTRVRYRRFG